MATTTGELALASCHSLRAKPISAGGSEKLARASQAAPGIPGGRRSGRQRVIDFVRGPGPPSGLPPGASDEAAASAAAACLRQAASRQRRRLSRLPPSSQPPATAMASDLPGLLRT